MYKRILISRTDSIGDVMLTLPMLVWIKNKFPESELLFLGRSYTEPIINCFDCVDQFVNWTELENSPTAQRIEMLRDLNADVIIHVFPVKEIAALAKKVKIPVRIGTSHRAFHLLACNHRVNFTRKRSEMHEAQLNFELLRPLGLTEVPQLNELISSLAAFKVPKVELPEFIGKELSRADKTIILHPKSQGSAVEWPMEKYIELSGNLVNLGYTVFFTGTGAEGDLYRELLPDHERIIDTTGKMDLQQLICFISRVNALVACSTGPLHIAGFTGIRAIGLFSPRKPIHPGRWGALGVHATSLVYDQECPICKKGKSCTCISDISVQQVLDALR
jgi:heptosyltransferase-3